MTTQFRDTSGPLFPRVHFFASQPPGTPREGSPLPWDLRRESIGRNPSSVARPKMEFAPLSEEKTEKQTLSVADFMTRNVVSVSTATTVRAIADILAAKRVSAVPVVGSAGKLVGIVSEGDLLRRPELGTEQKRSRLRWLFLDARLKAAAYVRTHGRLARHVMTTPVVTATEEMSLREVVDNMERRRVKRLPVVRSGSLVGIISRGDLLRALAQHRYPTPTDPPRDELLLRELLLHVEELAIDPTAVNVMVHRGNVALTGLVFNGSEIEALIVAAQNTPGVKSVQSHLKLRRAYLT